MEFTYFALFALASCKKDPNGGNGGNNDEPKFVAAAEIDGNFVDWKDVVGLEREETSTSPYLAFKVTYDEKFVYFYSKREWNDDALWNNGYFYYCVDNVPNAGDPNVNGQHNFGEENGIDSWFFVYLFTGGADAPVIATAPSGDCSAKESFLSSITSAGKISSDKEYIETELSVPRENLAIEKGQTVKFFSWGNKSASNLRDKPLTITIEK